METKNIRINLPEGEFDAKLQFFTENDREIMWKIYRNWRSLCDDLRSINSRAVNLPEGLSEGAFALVMGTPRIQSSISGANTSFDCFDVLNNDRLQIKACSTIPDLSSFGPKSAWDKLYFCDFYRQGLWDGSFDIYLIENEKIYNHHVNENQTFKDQQRQGRRPRFSIYSDIIKKHQIRPIKTGNLGK